MVAGLRTLHNVRGLGGWLECSYNSGSENKSAARAVTQLLDFHDEAVDDLDTVDSPLWDTSRYWRISSGSV